MVFWLSFAYLPFLFLLFFYIKRNIVYFMREMVWATGCLKWLMLIFFFLLQKYTHFLKPPFCVYHIIYIRTICINLFRQALFFIKFLVLSCEHFRMKHVQKHLKGHGTLPFLSFLWFCLVISFPFIITRTRRRRYYIGRCSREKNKIH